MEKKLLKALKIKLNFIQMKKEVKDWIDKNFHNPLKSKFGFTFTVQKLYGTDFFLPAQFAVAGTGAISFKAHGQHLRFSFTDTKENTRGVNKKVYIVVIGAVRNRVSFIKTSNVKGNEGSVLFTKKAPEMGASPYGYKSFWITIKNGCVRVGKGDNIDDEKELMMSGYDKESPLLFKYVGISGWESPINFKCFRHFDEW